MSKKSQTSQADASKIKSLTEKRNLKTKSDLQKELEEVSDICISQKYQIEKITEDMHKKDDKIRHLEAMLQKAVPLIGEESEGLLSLSDEEEIALQQLDRLKRISQERSFTKDEAQMYDLFTKNKRLAQGKSTTINAAYDKIKSLPQKDLLELADVTRKNK